jgi:urease beta subunit
MDLAATEAELRRVLDAVPFTRAYGFRLHAIALGSARHEPFRCTARVVKLGRRLVYGVAESVSGNGRLQTHHSLTYARR